MRTGTAFTVKIVWREVGQSFRSEKPLSELLDWAERKQAEVGDTARVTIQDHRGTVVYDWIADWWQSEEYRRLHSVARPSAE